MARQSRPRAADWRRRKRPFTTIATPLALGAAVTLAMTACGRSGSDKGGGQPTTGTSTAASSSASASSNAAGPGDFGTLKKVCGPGDAKGATERGVTDTQIRIAVTADPG